VFQTVVEELFNLNISKSEEEKNAKAGQMAENFVNEFGGLW